MVARLMRWPWPTGSSKKFAVRLILRGIDGFPVDKESGAETRMKAEVRWKGKTRALRSLRSVKRNCTREDVMNGDGGKVEWNEEFESEVVLTAQRENGFNPWEIEIAVFCGLQPGNKNKTIVVGMTSLNLAEYASAPGEEFELNLPLLLCSSAESCPIIQLSLRLFELRPFPQQKEAVQKPATSPSSLGDKDELSSLKAGFRRVFREFMPGRKFRKTLRGDGSSDGKSSVRTEDSYYADTDSMEDDERDEEIEYCKDNSTTRKSFCYGTLAAANMLGVTIYNDIKLNDEHEDLIYYSHRRSDVDCSHVEEAMPSIPEKSPKRSILPWKKRKYSFRSPKAKGEPLLKKAYGEEGGDDIDYDRRLLTSSDESLSGKKSDDDGSAHHSSISDFGDDNFAVGSWDSKEIISRCGQMKLSTQVFFASIDQRSERAAGQSACTALVAVIADWFQSNQNIMPVKSQLDSLIREGSFEWRNLCKNQTYREQFPDKHFDLETILQAKIRPLSVVSGKSFIGFFRPDLCEDNRGFEFLHGAMSFDSIWEEISQVRSDCVFIVSWNDHFFVLKVERDAYYIIDTLGERLYEGCEQAYILKFDKSTTIHKLPSKKESSANGKEGSSCGEESECDRPEEEQQLVCNGKESCKEYIKSFLAAIPIRELQADAKKGLMASTPLHQRLQIEFHYTEPSKDLSNFVAFPPLQSTGSNSLISWPAYPSPSTEQTLTV
ncbi:hypothetical protein KFK09_020715 [Dendrobium nobile]|uniref:C2 NT-type domain-containing protein n=1 Tax=Dendrobium nobile TaxID=94219 RepID=A0A8T3ALN7_DENNO|nr:hypothetical protein KFK09_020715 [Dendrobium nobile]